MPNTIDKWEITAQLHGERAEFWQRVLGTDTVPIISPLPQYHNLPGVGAQPCLMLDLKVLTSEMREALIAGIAGRFNLATQEVARDIDKAGVPILYDNVYITCKDQGLMLSMAELGAELAPEEATC